LLKKFFTCLNKILHKSERKTKKDKILHLGQVKEKIKKQNPSPWASEGN